MFGRSPPLQAMHNIADFELAARRRLPRGLFDYIARGVEDDLAVRRNRSAFAEIGFRPRVLADVSQRQQNVRILDPKRGDLRPSAAAGGEGGEEDRPVADINLTVAGAGLEQLG